MTNTTCSVCSEATVSCGSSACCCAPRMRRLPSSKNSNKETTCLQCGEAARQLHPQQHTHRFLVAAIGQCGHIEGEGHDDHIDLSPNSFWLRALLQRLMRRCSQGTQIIQARDVRVLAGKSFTAYHGSTTLTAGIARQTSGPTCGSTSVKSLTFEL